MTLEFTALSDRTSHFKLRKKVFQRIKNTLKPLPNYPLHSACSLWHFIIVLNLCDMILLQTTMLRYFKQSSKFFSVPKSYHEDEVPQQHRNNIPKLLIEKRRPNNLKKCKCQNWKSEYCLCALSVSENLSIMNFSAFSHSIFSRMNF